MKQANAMSKTCKVHKLHALQLAQDELNTLHTYYLQVNDNNKARVVSRIKRGFMSDIFRRKKVHYKQSKDSGSDIRSFNNKYVAIHK